MSDSTSKADLEARARELDISGRSKMTAPELEAAVAAAEDAARQAEAEAAARAELENPAARGADPAAITDQASHDVPGAPAVESARTVRGEGRPPLAEVARAVYERTVIAGKNLDAEGR